MGPSSLLFLKTGECPSDNFFSKTDKALIIDCTQKDKIYFAIFKILKILDSSIDLDKFISSFKESFSNVFSVKYDLVVGEEGSKNQVFEKDSKLKIFLQKKIILGFFFFVIVILLVYFFVQNSSFLSNQIPTQVTISSDFSIPHNNILLKRFMLMDKIKKSFYGKDPIEIAVLIGAGGSGKTTIARQYALEQISSITWEVNAETKDTLMVSFEKLAYALSNNLEERRILNTVLEIKNTDKREMQLMLLVQNKIKKAQNWLLIYDNLEAFKGIQRYFPRNFKTWGKGKVIITTRDTNLKNANFIGVDNMIEVKELTKKEKLDLFLKIIRNTEGKQLLHSKEIIKEFLEQIPSFPLDVSIAAYYLRETGMQYKDYLKYTSDLNEEFLASQQNITENVNEYSKTRYGIVSLSAKNIIDTNKNFRDLLFFISLLDSQEIPKNLLVAYKNDVIVSDFFNQLKKNHFINDTSVHNTKKINGSDAFSMHRSTQSITLNYLINSLSPDIQRNTLQSITNSIEHYLSYLAEAEDSLKLKVMENHYKSLLHKGDRILSRKERVLIEGALGVICYYLGYDIQAQQILEANLKDLNLCGQQNSVDYAWILLHLGAIHRKLGVNYAKAIKLLDKSIDIYKKHSPNSIGIAMALTHLGNTYRTIGNFEKAKVALQKAIKIFESHTKSYAGTARALSYLGVVYREQREYEKAKSLFDKSIEMYSKNNHTEYSSNFAGTIAHLGVLHRMMGNYEQAKGLLYKSVKIYKQIRPEKHPDNSKNILNLGIIHGELGEYQEAKDLLHQSLTEYEDNYGKNHIETGKVLNHLGRVYILANDIENAQIVLDRALLILEESSHPEAYRALELLGDVHMKMIFVENKNRDNNAKEKILKDQPIDYYKRALKVARSFFTESSAVISRLNEKMKDISVSAEN